MTNWNDAGLSVSSRSKRGSGAVLQALPTSIRSGRRIFSCTCPVEIGENIDKIGRYGYAQAMRFIVLIALFAAQIAWGGAVRVASLHPLLSEMARRVGGEDVEVVDLFPPHGELHRFEPGAQELAAAVRSRLILACGKGVEPYLGALREVFSAANPPVRVLELGDAAPDVMTPEGSLDPHWWNAPENMKRAAFGLALALAEELPEQQEAIRARLTAYAQAMDELTREARLALAHVPEERRTLVTEHAAMCHFCAAFRLHPIAVQGAAAEGEGDMASVAQLTRELRRRGVRRVYAELREAPRFLQNIAAAAGAEVGELSMDGVAPGQPTYETLFRNNLRAVCEGFLCEKK